MSVAREVIYDISDAPFERSESGLARTEKKRI